MIVTHLGHCGSQMEVDGAAEVVHSDVAAVVSVEVAERAHAALEMLFDLR